MYLIRRVIHTINVEQELVVDRTMDSNKIGSGTNNTDETLQYMAKKGGKKNLYSATKLHN